MSGHRCRLAAMLCLGAMLAPGASPRHARASMLTFEPNVWEVSSESPHTTEPASTDSTPQPESPLYGPDPVEPAISAVDDTMRQLVERTREALLDPAERPESRRKWADQLLDMRCAAADEAVHDLLRQGVAVATVETLTRAIADRMRTSPDRFPLLWVDPLIALLGHESSAIRDSAAQALGYCPVPDMPERLFTLAVDGNAPAAQRMASVDGMALCIHRRDVVARLMGLLEQGDSVLLPRILVALDPLSSDSATREAQAWLGWWEQHWNGQSGSPQAENLRWSQYIVRVFRDRQRGLTAKLAGERADSEKQIEQRNAKLMELQRELFRATAPDQRHLRLVQWLSDPLHTLQEGAVELVLSQIVDSGTKPAPEVVTALLATAGAEKPSVRRKVLALLPHLEDPRVVEVILARAELEKEQATRVELFTAMGKVADARGAAVILRELERDNADPACIRAAAVALARIAERSVDPSSLAPVVSTLKARYAATPADGTGTLRPALLDAMAAVGDAAFRPEFAAAMESSDLQMLRGAIEGLTRLKDIEFLARFRALAGHADPKVRLEAVNALAALGSGEADLDRVVLNMNPATETDAQVRAAAQRALRTLLASRSVADRLAWSKKLATVPAAELTYLQDLLATLGPTELDEAAAVRLRLATIHVAQKQFGEAASHYRELYQLESSRKSEQVSSIAVAWLNAELQRKDISGLSAVVLRLLEENPTNGTRKAVADAIKAYCDALDVSAEPQRASLLLAQMESIAKRAPADPWEQLTSAWRSKIGQMGQAAPPASDVPSLPKS